MIRTICIPVAEAVSHTKSEFYQALRKSLDLAVRVANVSATHCLKQDDLTQDKPPKIYTYPMCSSLVPGMSFVAASVCRATEKTYKQDRWQVRNGKRSARSFRSMPWPMLHNKSCSTFTLNDRGEWIEATIKLMGGEYTVRLAGGSNYRDQVKGLRSGMLRGQIKDSKIWIDRKHKAILGIAVDFPVITNERSGTVSIASTAESIAVMTVPRWNRPFVVNCDDVQQWKSESVRRNQRWRQARKQGVDRRRLREASHAFARKMQKRLQSKTHEAAAQLVAKADRLNAQYIELDLTIKSVVPAFPWYEFAAKIKYKAAKVGIEVIEKTQSIVEPSLDSPHVYFVYDMHSHRVKIGKTKGGKGRLESYLTSNPDWVVLAVDNQSQAKLGAREKHYHGIFDQYRVVNRNKIGNEVFEADPVIAWLRAVGWLGNAGNLSQIAQVLDVSLDASRGGHLQADSERSGSFQIPSRSQNADKRRGYVCENAPALATINRLFES